MIQVMYVYILKLKEANTINTKYKNPHASPSVLLFSPEESSHSLLCVILVV